MPYDRDWANLAGVGTGGHESRDRSFVGLDPGELGSFSLRRDGVCLPFEEIFGWAKTVGGLRKVRFTGLSKVRAQTTFTFAAYNLTRMAAILG